MRHVDVVTDLRDLSAFRTGSVTEVYAAHVLEHFSHRELSKVLWEWTRVLSDGGRLRLAVPDFDKIIALYRASGQDVESIELALMGGQSYEQNCHYSLFNFSRLNSLLQKLGYTTIGRYDPFGFLPKGVQDESLHPMSLNVLAER